MYTEHKILGPCEWDLAITVTYFVHISPLIWIPVFELKYVITFELKYVIADIVTCPDGSTALISLSIDTTCLYYAPCKSNMKYKAFKTSKISPSHQLYTAVKVEIAFMEIWKEKKKLNNDVI